MIEYSSAPKTFSMSRWAIRLPMVARRSPAITTPPSKAAATIVVPCGASSWVGRGRASGAVRVSRSANDERAAWWERSVAVYPPYGDYQERTERTIPVLVASPI